MFSTPIVAGNYIELEEDTFDNILKGIRLNNVKTFIQLEHMREEMLELERTFSRKLLDSENGTLALIENISSICDEWKRGEKVKSRTNGTCVICLDSNPSYIARPCNHLILCRDCYDSVPFDDFTNKCPKCKREMTHCEIVYT